MESSQITRVNIDETGKHFMTDQQVLIVAKLLNAAIDIPLINESIEEIIFVKLVKLFDALLYKIIPNEILDFINMLDGGLSAEEAVQLKETLKKRARKEWNLPFLSEEIESKIFNFLIDFIVDAMVKGTNLLTLAERRMPAGVP